MDYPGDSRREGHVVAVRPESGEDVKMAEVLLGRIANYYDRIGVAAIEITQDTLAVGDTIHIKGHISDFTQTIDAMQIDGKSVPEATVGESVAIRAAENARENDAVFKVIG